MSKRVKLRLIVDVEYDPGTMPIRYLKGMLEDLPRRAVGEGLFTGWTNAEVETWTARVEVLESDTGPNPGA